MKKSIFGPFWARFAPICPTRFFLENRALSLLSTYGALTSCKKSEKTNDSILRNYWKSIFSVRFGPVLPQFARTRFFLENRALSLLSTYGALTSCKKSEKTNDSILRNYWKSLFSVRFGPVLPQFARTRFFLENRALSLLSTYGALTSCKKSEKNNDSILRNYWKSLFSVRFGPVLPQFARTRFFLENRALSLLSTYGALTSCKKSEKTNDSILRNYWKSLFSSVLGPFCPNLPEQDFSWKIGLCHFWDLWCPNFMQKIRKN